MASLNRSNILRCYRELLSLINRLPPDKKQMALQEARSNMKANSGELDPMKASDMHKDLVARISFLKIATPRLPGDKSRIGAGTFVLRDGSLVQEDLKQAER